MNKASFSELLFPRKKNKAKKVLLLSKYSRLGASSRLRSFQYIPYLKNEGFDIEIQSLFSDDYLRDLYQFGKRNKKKSIIYYLQRSITLLSIFKYDLIWVEYEIFPYFPALVERLLHLFKVSYIVDYDDAIFHNYDQSSNPYIRNILGRKIDNVMRLSNHVLAGNIYLAQRARHARAENITIIPTVVDHIHYNYIPSGAKTRQLTIGWIGSPSTQKYILEIYPALLAACQAFNARLLLIGATEDISHNLSGIKTQILPWSEKSEISHIKKMDIGIMPLHDGPWERGKCGYKIIQYMACAVAVVATPVGINHELIVENNAGLLASTMEDWQHALFELLQSPTLRQDYGENGQKSVAAKYSIQSQLPKLIRILNQAIPKKAESS